MYTSTTPLFGFGEISTNISIFTFPQFLFLCSVSFIHFSWCVAYGVISFPRFFPTHIKYKSMCCHITCWLNTNIVICVFLSLLLSLFLLSLSSFFRFCIRYIARNSMLIHKFYSHSHKYTRTRSMQHIFLLSSSLCTCFYFISFTLSLALSLSLSRIFSGLFAFIGLFVIHLAH